MIRYIGLKSNLLKAINLSKDHSGLVLVERIETNSNGTTYRHNHWVRPDQVKATDKVLRGHHNLPKNHVQHLSAMTVGRLSQQSKDKVNEFFKKFSSLDDFCDALTQMNIPWKKSTDSRINLMWAKMGLRAVIHNGFDVDKVWDKIKSSVGIQSNTQTSPQQTQPTQQATSGSKKSSKGGITSQEAKDKANEFYKTFNNDKQSFFTALKNMGVTWKENSDERINYMFAKTALGKAIDAGLDPFNANNNQPKQATPPSTPPPPPKDPDLIEAPPNATLEQLAWIEHINKITDLDVLKKCSVLGMVPEDVVSQRYLSNVAFGEMVKAYEGKGTADMVDATRDAFKIDVESVGLSLEEPKNRSWGGTRNHNTSNNIDKLTKLAKISGMKDQVISQALTDRYSRFSMESFTNPVNVLNKINNSYFNLFESLNSAYSDYTTDKYAEDPDYRGDIRNYHHTNLGYIGADPDEYSERFDLQKEGVVRFLNKVAESSDDPDAKAKANELISDYGEIMKVVNGNHLLLKNLLQSGSYLSNEKPRNFSVMFATRFGARYPEPGRAKALYEELEHNSDKLADVIAREFGNNVEAMKRTLKENTYNSNFYDGNSIDIYDEKGNKLRTVDLSNEGFKFGEIEHKIDDFEIEYAYYKARQKLNLSVDLSDPDVMKEFTGVTTWSDNKITGVLIGVKSLKQLSNISFSDYQKVHGFANKFLGKRLNVSDWKEDTNVRDIPYIFEDTNNGSDSVYTNMIMTYNNHDINSKIADRADSSPSSQLNHHGMDYSRNFSYYSSNNLKNKNYRYKSAGEGWDSSLSQFGSAQELSDKVAQQLNNTKIYSPEYIQKVKDFYDAKAKSEGLASGVIASKGDKLGNYSNLDDLKNSPLNEIVHDSLVNALQYVPKMADKVNFRKSLDKRLGYSEFDFDSAIAELNKIQVPTQSSGNIDSLKGLRQKLFNKATCSIQTLPPKESDGMQQDILKNRFDYKKGEKTPDGTVVNERVHKGRRIFFNTPMFKINNTAQWKKRYEDSKQTMIANGADKEAYEDIDLFHGTKKWCLGGIIGRDQGWYMGEEAESAGKMLGAGGYFGYKAGKSTVYACDNVYSNIKYNKFSDDDNSANGVLILVKGMRGENSIRSDTNYMYTYGVGTKKDMQFTSVSADQGNSSLNDYEIAIKRNENILPEFFVDVSCRHLFKNIAVDKDGNYYEMNSDYEKVADAQKDYYDRKNRGVLRPGEKKPDDWDGKGYTPKWDKIGKKIGMDELTD